MDSSKSHDLLLLMVNLVQLKSKNLILEVFVEALQDICPKATIKYIKEISGQTDTIIPLSTAKSTFGALTITGYCSDACLDTLHNAAVMTALILEKLDQDKKLEQESENTLKEEKEFSETLLDAAKDTIFVFDPKTRRPLRWNKNFKTICGYSDTEIAKMKAPDDFYSPEDQKRAYSSLSQLPETGKAVVDIELITKNGKKIPFEYSVTNIKDKNGKDLFLSIGRDISERKKSEENLLESEKRYRELFTSMLDGFALHEMIFDKKNQPKDYRFLEVNPAFEKITGLAAEKVIGKTVLELMPETEQFWIQTYGEVVLSGKPERFENYSRELDKYFEVLAYPAEGNKFVTIISDITKRKKLDEERQKFFMLAESSSDFIGMCDLDMKPLYVNPAGVRMVGLPDMAAACRVKVQDYFFPEDQSFIRDEFFPRVLQEGHGEVEIRLRHFQTGKAIWMFYYLFHVRDASGKVVGWAAVSRDITERKLSEEKLKENQQLLKMAQELGHIGSWRLDIEKNELIWSDENYKIFGVPVGTKNLTYEAFLSCIHPDDRKYVDEKWQAAVNGAPYDIEHRLLVNDETKWVREKAELSFDKKGNVIHATGFTQDITDQKLTEEALRQSEATLQTAMDNSLVGILLADAPSGKIRYLNEAGLIIRGKSKQEVVDGVGIEQYVASWKVMHLDGTPYRDDEVPLARAITQGETCTEELVIGHGDDESRIVWVNAAPIKDEQGKIIAGVAVFMDITERKKTESELIKYRESLEALVEEKTRDLQRTVNLMAGREIRMKELKEIIRELQQRLKDAGLSEDIDEEINKRTPVEPEEK